MGKEIGENMEHEIYDKLLKYQIKRMRGSLASKSAEYSTESDKLHNFKRGGEIDRTSPEKALKGMYLKHLISILDIVDDLEAKCGINKDCFPSFYENRYMRILEEKIKDAINYHSLLEALIIERYKNIFGRYPSWLNLEKE